MAPKTRSASKKTSEDSFPREKVVSLKTRETPERLSELFGAFSEFAKTTGVDVPDDIVQKFFDTRVQFPSKKKVDPEEKKFRVYHSVGKRGPFSENDIDIMKGVVTKKTNESQFHSLLTDLTTSFKEKYFKNAILMTPMFSTAVYNVMRGSQISETEELGVFLETPTDESLGAFVEANEELIVDMISKIKEHKRELRAKAVAKKSDSDSGGETETDPDLDSDPVGNRH